MVKTRARAPSGRVYSSAIPPRQRKLRNIMNPLQKSRRRVSAGPVSSLRQETMTQMVGFVFGGDENNFDVENEPPYEEDAEPIQRERKRKRRKTLGDSPADRDLLSRKKQSTLTQIDFLKPLAWRDPELEEADDEDEAYVKREESVPIWEDDTAEPVKGIQGEKLQHMRLRSRRSNEEYMVRRDDREVGDSDAEDDQEAEDNREVGDDQEVEYGQEVEDDQNLEDGQDLQYEQDEVDDIRGDIMLGKESNVVRGEEEVGDSDEEPSAEDLEQDGNDQDSQDGPESNSSDILPACHTHVRICNSMGPPVTPRKKRYEIPDSDAESEDISPEKGTPIRAASSQQLPTTPSKRTPRFRNPIERNPIITASKSSTTKAPVTFSQATTVDHTQYAQSQGTSALRTTSHKSSHQDLTSTSPFVLRQSQLLTESQMLPDSLMGTIPLPPCWIDSDEEDQIHGGTNQRDDENDDDEEEEEEEDDEL